MILSKGMLVKYNKKIPWIEQDYCGIIVEINEETCLIFWQNETITRDYKNDLEVISK